jgi:hypothetical protein
MAHLNGGDMDSRPIIKVVLIVALIGSIWYLMGSSQDYSCDKCSVTLKTSKSMPITYNMSDLFEQSKFKHCPVYWDRVMGYVKH